jgi:ornithine cyclodeaminase
MIAPGMHINGVGGDCPGKTELHGDVLRMPGMRVVVEFEPQSRIEGEIQQMPADYPVIELAQVVRGEVVARRSERDITLFDSVGFALEDYSALRFLYSIIVQQRLGRRELDLVPDLDDPKDLYGGTLSAQRGRVRKRKLA